jgi:hypothetical protein
LENPSASDMNRITKMAADEVSAGEVEP